VEQQPKENTYFRYIFSPSVEEKRYYYLLLDGIDVTQIYLERNYHKIVNGKHKFELYWGQTLLSDMQVELEEEEYYTIAIHDNELFLITDELACPQSGYAIFQIYSVKKVKTLRLDHDLIFEMLEPEEFTSIQYPLGIYDIIIDESQTLEIELQPSMIYTLIIINNPFIIENEDCQNII
jgi:hypothetical protein